MPKTDAIRIYREHFWKRPYIDIMSQAVVIKLIDTCVDVGTAQDHRLFQHAIVAFGEHIVIDGTVGHATVAAANQIPAQQLLELMLTEQARFYTDLVQYKPHLGHLLCGWLRSAAF